MSIVSGAAKQGSTRGFYPRVINGSLRFNDNDSAYLSWTPASAGNRKTWTWSGWVKRANVSTGSEQMIFAARDASGVQTTFYFTPADKIQFYSENGGGIGNIVTTAVYRDPSAWYHIVFRFDAANTSLKIYVNGVEQTVSVFTAVSNTDHAINSTITQGIGYSPTSGQYADFYLAEVHFTDGTAYDADAFGELKNGVWVAKTPEVTYGTNGFYLDFQDDTEVEAFNTVLYRGDGISGRSITGMGFEPDLIWIKSRSGAQWHHLFDQVRGGSKRLHSNSTNAESTLANSQILSFDSDGYTVTEGENVNGSGISYVAWGWKAGDSNVSNTDGSITSTVRANDTYGFSIVSYTGTGSAGDSFGHGLGTAPSMIFIKDRSAANSWTVWHGAIMTNAGYLVLDGTQAANTTDTGYWNATAPSSSVVTLGTRARVNTSGNNYVAYCWAEKTGYSKFGSYIGSSGDPSVTTGFKPAFVLIKRTDAAGNSWSIWDNTRDTEGDGNLDLPLFPNLSNAEDTSSYTDYVQFTDTGFVVKGNGAFVNGGTSSYEYIYAAFADTREAAFWLDQSGNDNDWQPINLDHNDTVADSPTDNFATMNPLDKGSEITLSDGNLTITSTAGGQHSVRGTMALGEGQWYFEFTLDSFGGGIQPFHWGIAKNNASVTSWVSGGDYVVMEDNGALKVDGGSLSYYSGGFVAGDVIGVAVDVTNDSITFYKNGTSLGAYSYTIEAGEYLPYVGDGSGVRYGVTTANFGQQPFKYDPPA